MTYPLTTLLADQPTILLVALPNPISQISKLNDDLTVQPISLMGWRKKALPRWEDMNTVNVERWAYPI